MSVLRSIAAVVLVAGLAAACTSSGGATTAPASAAPASAAAAAGGDMAIVVTAGTSPTLGMYLIGPKSLALYTKTGDTATTSTCTGTCAVAWPPLLVATGGAASGGSGVTGTFATLTRADGTVQVTYAGLPLYYWKGDSAPTDTTGEGVNGFLVAGVAGPIPAPSASGKPGY